MIGVLLALAAVAWSGDVRSRTTVGVLGEVAQSTGDVGAEWLLGETLHADVVETDRLSATAHAAGRLGIRTLDGRLDRVRLRALGLEVRRGRVHAHMGRFAPTGGGIRLVDGVQVLTDVGGGVSIGAWAGLSPDVVSTAPAFRYGGGPIATWVGDGADASVLGEILATKGRLDRASAVARGHVEVGHVAEIEGLVDVQADADRYVRLSDATVIARLDPTDAVRIDLSYDAWSSLSYLVSAARDPLVRRFAERSQALSGDPWNPQDRLDSSVHQQIWARMAWTGAAGNQTVRLVASARARPHADPVLRHVRAVAGGQLMGLAHGRMDLGIAQGVLAWPMRTASLTTASLWVGLDPDGLVALDASAELVTQPIIGSTIVGPSVYADAFVDAVVSRRFVVSAGYAFSNTQDLDRWDTWHGAMVRATMRVDTRRSP